MRPVSLRQYLDKESSTYTYILFDKDTRKGVIIDPVLDQLERDIDSIKKLNLNIEAILETHVHADHITAAYQLKKITTAPIYYGSKSGVEGSDYLLDDNETLSIENFEIKTLHTPGHTKESVTYYCCGMLFTGDTLFIGSSGRTDFQGGDPGMLYDSITKILFLYPDDTRVYPAHDYTGKLFSTIGEEKLWNESVGQGMNKEKFIETEKKKNRPYPKKIDLAMPANMKCGKI